MTILLIHNYYKQRGGEDIVFEAESKLLESYDNKVKKIIFDNKNIISIRDKFQTGLLCSYNSKSAKMIEREIKKIKPKIIHVHNFFPLISPSVFYVANKNNIPIVLTLHNFRLICPNAILFRDGKICESCVNKTFPFKGMLKKCYRNSLFQTIPLSMMISVHKILKTWQNNVDKFIVLTEFQKRKFLESSINIHEKNIVVKSNFCENYGIGTNRKDFFLYVGRLTKEKGILTILEATRYFDFKLKIAGDGPLKRVVLNYSQHNKNIEYLGVKTKKEVINLMKQCKALIFPSLWYETFGLVIIEAFSTGTPVIASDIGTSLELVEHQYNGLHFRAGSYEDLVRKIKTFLEITTSRFYGNARKTYLEKYTPEKNYVQLIGIYREVINASKKKSNKP